MSEAIDKLIPLAIFTALGALVGWLVSLATGYASIAVMIGAAGGLLLLIALGVLLPEVDQ